MTFLINPYYGWGEPVTGERLVGRNQQLDRLVKRIKSYSHCSIVGLPRIGKTSLARECLRLLKSSQSCVDYCELTLDAISCPTHAYNRILIETAGDRQDEDIIVGIHNHDEAYESFLRVLRRRKCAGQKSVVAIDEFDAIIRDDFADAQLFVSRIREVANNQERYGVTFIFISRRSLDMIQGAVDCSTLAGLCEVFYLKPLEQDGLAKLASRSPIPVNNDGLNSLWYITGGHPFLAEVVMCEAVERCNLILDAEAINSALYAQAHEFINQYGQLHHLLSHGDMFDALCELIVGPFWRQVSPYTECLLRQYGLLRSNDQHIECMSQHFKDYLGLLTRTTPTWVLLGDTERQLRNLIHGRMQETYGENWFDRLSQKFPSMRELQSKLIEFMVREKQRFGDAASNFILDYAYIGDLKSLILVEWVRYRDILEEPKSNWVSRFESVIKVRNPMAHHRVVPLDVIQEAENSCKAFLGRLAGSVQ